MKRILALRGAMREIDDRFNETVTWPAMTVPRFIVLGNLSANEPVPMRKIVDRTLMDRSTVSFLVKSLHDCGLVSTQRGVGDTRRVNTVLTKLGVRAYNETAMQWVEVCEALEKEQSGRSTYITALLKLGTLAEHKENVHVVRETQRAPSARQNGA